MVRDYTDAVSGYLAQGDDPSTLYRGPYKEVLQVLKEMEAIDSYGVLLFNAIEMYWTCRSEAKNQDISTYAYIKTLGRDLYVRKMIDQFKNGLPPIMRRIVWTRLLGAHHIVTSNMDISLELVDTHNSLNSNFNTDLSTRIIRCDVDRTRSALNLFRKSEIKLSMEAVLACYTKSKSCSYKQGMNEILAPFFTLITPYVKLDRFQNADADIDFNVDIGNMLRSYIEQANDGKPIVGSKLINLLNFSPIHTTRKGCIYFVGQPTATGNLQDVYELFSLFISRYAPYILRDDDLSCLQCLINRFQLLLNFFDPLLAVKLVDSQLSPELYVVGWFVTVFACKTQLDLTLNLWDRIISEDDPFFTAFIAISLLISKRDIIMSSSTYLMPEILSKLTFGSHNDVRAICHGAKVYRSLAPISFVKELDALLPKSDVNCKELLKAWENDPAVAITATELKAQMLHAKLRKPDKTKLQWILVDVRPDELVGGSGRFQHTQTIAGLQTNWLSSLAVSLQLQIRRNPKCEPNHCIVLMGHLDEKNKNLDQTAFVAKIHEVLTMGYKMPLVCILKEGTRGWHDVMLTKQAGPAKRNGIISDVLRMKKPPLLDHTPEKCQYCSDVADKIKNQTRIQQNLINSINVETPSGNGIPYSWSQIYTGN